MSTRADKSSTTYITHAAMHETKSPTTTTTISSSSPSSNSSSSSSSSSSSILVTSSCSSRSPKMPSPAEIVERLLSKIRDPFCGNTFPKICNNSQRNLVLFVTAIDPQSALPDYTVRPKFTREIPPNGDTSLDCRKLQDIESYAVNVIVALWVFPKIAGDPTSNPGSYFEPAVRAKGYFIGYRDLKEKRVIALDVKDGKVIVTEAAGAAA